MILKPFRFCCDVSSEPLRKETIRKRNPKNCTFPTSIDGSYSLLQVKKETNRHIWGLEVRVVKIFMYHKINVILKPFRFCCDVSSEPLRKETIRKRNPKNGPFPTSIDGSYSPPKVKKEQICLYGHLK